MTGRTPTPVVAWLRLQTTLAELADANYVLPCIDLIELFVSDDPARRREAVPWCEDCPALEPCADYADAAKEPFHVWGGRDRAPRSKSKEKP